MSNRRRSEEVSSHLDDKNVLWIEDSPLGRRLLEKLHQVEKPSDIEVLPHIFRLIEDTPSDTPDTR